MKIIRWLILSILSFGANPSSARYITYNSRDTKGKLKFLVLDRLKMVETTGKAGIPLSNQVFAVVCACKSIREARKMATALNITAGLKGRKRKVKRFQLSIEDCRNRMSKEGWDMFRYQKIAEGQIDPKLWDGWDAVWLTQIELEKFGISTVREQSKEIAA